MDLVIAGGVAIASLIPIFGLKRDIHQIKNTLKEMEGLQTYSPGEIYDLLKQGKDIMKYFKESDNGETIQGKIFLQGKIDAKYPIKSVLVDRDLIYRKFYVDNIYSNDRGSKIIKNNNKRFISFTQNGNNQVITEYSPYMDLHNFQSTQNNSNQNNDIYSVNNSVGDQISTLLNQDIRKQMINNPNHQSQISIRIFKNIQANYKYALQLIDIKRHFKKLNFAENTIIIIGFLIEFIFSLLHLKLRGRGIKVGYQEVEFGIPIQTLITVFGELIFHKKTGKMEMKKPEFFFNSEVRLKEDLKNKIGNKRILMILLFIPLIFSGGYLYQRLFKIIGQFIRKQRQRKEDQLKKMARLELDNLSCKICNENVRNIIFKPCHHMTHCKQCFENLLRERNLEVPNNNNILPNNSSQYNIPQDLECSICKQHVTSTVEVFVSQSGCFAPLFKLLTCFCNQKHILIFIYFILNYFTNILIQYYFENFIYIQNILQLNIQHQIIKENNYKINQIFVECYMIWYCNIKKIYLILSRKFIFLNLRNLRYERVQFHHCALFSLQKS